MLKISTRKRRRVMTSSKGKADMEPVEVITSDQRRRRFSAQEKRAKAEEAEQPGSSVTMLARLQKKIRCLVPLALDL